VAPRHSPPVFPTSSDDGRKNAEVREEGKQGRKKFYVSSKEIRILAAPPSFVLFTGNHRLMDLMTSWMDCDMMLPIKGSYGSLFFLAGTHTWYEKNK
jgi:hypothetical protein